MDTQDLEVWYKALKAVKLDDRPPLSSDERQALLNAKCLLRRKNA